MLAQDDDGSLQVFGTIVSSAGYRVLTAESGEEAVRLAMQEVPELNFTEARLPIGAERPVNATGGRPQRLGPRRSGPSSKRAAAS